MPPSNRERFEALEAAQERQGALLEAIAARLGVGEDKGPEPAAGEWGDWDEFAENHPIEPSDPPVLVPVPAEPEEDDDGAPTLPAFPRPVPVAAAPRENRWRGDVHLDNAIGATPTDLRQGHGAGWVFTDAQIANDYARHRRMFRDVPIEDRR